MSRTRRKQDPGLIRAIKRNAHREETMPTRLDPRSTRRLQRGNSAILRGQDGAILYDKCFSAQIDSQGGFKLDNWNETGFKRNGRDATRKMRRAGKIAVKRQIEELNDN